MAQLRLFWSETALKQRNQIFEYWNAKNKSNLYSKRLLFVIKERAALLLTYPEMGKEVDIEKTRVISLEHFSLFYDVDGDKIVVISFWDNRRNPKELLRVLKEE